MLLAQVGWFLDPQNAADALTKEKVNRQIIN